MRNKTLTVLVVVWATSIILLWTNRPTYIVEKGMDFFDFEFSSKEAYVLAVETAQWVRWLYFGTLSCLTFYLFKSHRSDQNADS
jgi:hypothetical protein